MIIYMDSSDTEHQARILLIRGFIYGCKLPNETIIGKERERSECCRGKTFYR